MNECKSCKSSDSVRELAIQLLHEWQKQHPTPTYYEQRWQKYMADLVGIPVFRPRRFWTSTFLPNTTAE